MRTKLIMAASTIGLAAGAIAPAFAAGYNDDPSQNLKLIDTVVVIYAENRSFDNLYGSLPGANGLQNASSTALMQVDRDGTPLKELPPVWGGLTAKGVTPPVTQADTQHLPNRPFLVDDPDGFKLPLGTITHDLWHRFYQNQMQINGGTDDKFVAWADSGGMVMSMWDGSKTAMWKVAQK